MPLEDHMHLVSVDDRLIEHPRVRPDRLDPAHPHRLLLII